MSLVACMICPIRAKYIMHLTVTPIHSLSNAHTYMCNTFFLGFFHVNHGTGQPNRIFQRAVLSARGLPSSAAALPGGCPLSLTIAAIPLLRWRGVTVRWAGIL